MLSTFPTGPLIGSRCDAEDLTTNFSVIVIIVVKANHLPFCSRPEPERLTQTIQSSRICINASARITHGPSDSGGLQLSRTHPSFLSFISYRPPHASLVLACHRRMAPFSRVLVRTCLVIKSSTLFSMSAGCHAP